jgi:hypothetical protein
MFPQQTDNNTTESKQPGQERIEQRLRHHPQQSQQTPPASYFAVPGLRSPTASPRQPIVLPPYRPGVGQTPHSADPSSGFYSIPGSSPFHSFASQQYIKQEPIPGPPELLIDTVEDRSATPPASIFSPEYFTGDPSGSRPMSSYSSSSQDSVYSTPGPQSYRLVSPYTMNDPRIMSQVSPGLVYVSSLFGFIDLFP